MKGDIYNFELNQNNHEKLSLADYKGKVFLIVNVSSNCTMTRQDRKLESLYQKYKDYGFTLIGVPSDNFHPYQKEKTYNYTFPVTESLSVKGSDQHPLYAFLTHEAPNSLAQFYSIAKKAFVAQKMEEGMVTDVLWNYEKFLIGKDGEIIQRFSSEIEPDDIRICQAIEGQIMI